MRRTFVNSQSNLRIFIQVENLRQNRAKVHQWLQVLQSYQAFLIASTISRLLVVNLNLWKTLYFAQIKMKIHFTRHTS